MYPSKHVAVTALSLVPLRRTGLAWRALAPFAAAAVLVDADHWLSYVVRTGDLSLRRAYRFHSGRVPRGLRWRLRRPYRPALWHEPDRPLHAGIAIAALFLAARRWPWLTPVAWGVLFHRLQDYAWEFGVRGD